MKNPFKSEKGVGQVRYVTTHTPIYRSVSSSSKEISQKLDKLIEETSTAPEKPHNPEKLKDESRKMIALTFVFTFVGIVGLVLLFVPIYNAIVFSEVRVVTQELTYQPLDIEKVLTTVGTILGTPLGFVVGYYFKEEHVARQGRQAKPDK